MRSCEAQCAACNARLEAKAARGSERYARGRCKTTTTCDRFKTILPLGQIWSQAPSASATTWRGRTWTREMMARPHVRPGR